ncbi:ribonuclease H-like protein [Linderina pennispora]|uniref:ribonuclease H n=1 Tax=Linderina pennispora TaxID=61395 RepID=A0A1Y1WDL6_9FUNG|nr:ribonuclease H-like protein [Linderina pennispora]ORX71326.1 ribonuclease H-like protein [Linderina pennispora]
MATTIAYADGAIDHRGGNDYTGVGIFFGRDDPRNFAGKLANGPQTIQRAELAAVAKALELAQTQPGEHVQVRTDSEYAINAINDVRKGAQPPSNSELVKQIVQATSSNTHIMLAGKDEAGNKVADSLARQAAALAG